MSEKWLYVLHLMKLSRNVPAAKLVEFVHVAPEGVANRSFIPMQLFQYSGRSAESQNRIFVISGLQGPFKNDVHLTSLLQKALQKNIFSPLADLFVSPVANPSSDPKDPWLNYAREDIRAFPEDSERTLCRKEIATLQRWIEMAKPKAIITLAPGTPSLNIQGAPTAVAQRLSDLMERPLLDHASQELSFAMPSLRDWALAQEIIWIELFVDETKKTFEEVREGEWKSSVGPALKWLIEAERFSPPTVETDALEHLVVPALEMPPEFAHLV
jgi:hypothetical protein